MTPSSGAIVYTIGHSTRPLDELIGMLAKAGVRRLADIRAIPRSRTNPQYAIDTLPAALADAGIEYRHLPKLGGRRARTTNAASTNAFWKHQAFRNYADYAATRAFREGLEELLDLAAERPTAIMCAEAVWWRCHRRIVADYLLANGWTVIHLMQPGRQERAEMTPGAVRHPDGTLTYPAPTGSLFD